MPPNPITSLDAAITFCFYTGRRWRGTSEFRRWAASIERQPPPHCLVSREEETTA